MSGHGAGIAGSLYRARSSIARTSGGKWSTACAHLQPALESGLLVMTIADKPQSSKQRYRLTAQGQAAVAKGAA